MLRGLGQATAYFAFCLAAVELLRREGVVRFDVFSTRTLLALVAAWLIAVVYRALRERAAVG